MAAPVVATDQVWKRKGRSKEYVHVVTVAIRNRGQAVTVHAWALCDEKGERLDEFQSYIVKEAKFMEVFVKKFDKLSEYRDAKLGTWYSDK